MNVFSLECVFRVVGRAGGDGCGAVHWGGEQGRDHPLVAPASLHCWGGEEDGLRGAHQGHQEPQHHVAHPWHAPPLQVCCEYPNTTKSLGKIFSELASTDFWFFYIYIFFIYLFFFNFFGTLRSAVSTATQSQPKVMEKYFWNFEYLFLIFLYSYIFFILIFYLFIYFFWILRSAVSTATQSQPKVMEKYFWNFRRHETCSGVFLPVYKFEIFCPLNSGYE